MFNALPGQWHRECRWERGQGQDSSPSPQQMLHTHFLGLLRADLARHVLKGLGGRGAILKGHTKRGF